MTSNAHGNGMPHPSPVASFSLINKWITCRHQAGRMYVTRDLPRGEASTPEQHWGDMVHDALAQRIRHKIPLPDKMKHLEKYTAPLDRYQIEPEMRISIASNGELTHQYEGSWLFCKIDCPILADDGMTAMLIDWKTGRSVREDPLELNIQALCLKAKYPKLQKIIGHYAWLFYDRMGLPHDCSDISRTWAIVNTHMKNIADAIRLSEFPKTPGPLCKWCPVPDCEYRPKVGLTEGIKLI